MVPVLQMRGLHIDAVSPDGPRTPIVEDIDLAVAPGEVLALIGESGSGKTTIALASLAYTRPGLEIADGQILLGGQDLLQLDREGQRRIRGRRVAYLAQSAAAAFNPAIPIGEQVIESAVLHGAMTRADAEARAEELYRALELPDPRHIGRRYPHEVSGGQLQRLMAAMALCGRPELLVLDEPTTALDVTTQIEVLKAFKTVIREQGAAAIYVTHDLPVVAQIADRILVLRYGRIQEAGTTEEIVRRPRHEYTRQLIAAVRPTPDERQAAAPQVAADSTVLSLSGVSAGYGPLVDGRLRAPVLRDVELSVGAGRVVGVIGESGCGKSTLARVIAGLLPAAAGTLELCGQPLAPALAGRTREELRRIQIVFQMADTALNPRQRIGDVLGRPLSFYHRLSGRARRARVGELLETVDLPGRFAERYPDELSGGQKQRVNLARALAARPDVLLCDEVTSGLDTVVGAHVIALLRRLRSETGTSMVFISHDLSTVASFADEIAVLYAGRIVECGPASRVLAPPWHPYTRLLISSVPELRPGWLEETPVAQARSFGVAAATAAGCAFAPRCPLAVPGLCDTTPPPEHSADDGHRIACHVVRVEPAEVPPGAASLSNRKVAQ